MKNRVCDGGRMMKQWVLMIHEVEEGWSWLQTSHRPEHHAWRHAHQDVDVVRIYSFKPRQTLTNFMLLLFPNPILMSQNNILAMALCYLNRKWRPRTDPTKWAGNILCHTWQVTTSTVSRFSALAGRSWQWLSACFCTCTLMESTVENNSSSFVHVDIAPLPHKQPRRVGCETSRVCFLRRFQQLSIIPVLTFTLPCRLCTILEHFPMERLTLLWSIWQRRATFG